MDIKKRLDEIDFEIETLQQQVLKMYIFVGNVMSEKEAS